VGAFELIMDLIDGYEDSYCRKIFNVLMIFLVYSSTIYFFSFITADPDLWGHIKFGKDLWALKALSRFDIYSYTAQGQEWINHEWLAELLMYCMFNVFGSPGLLVGKTMIGLVIITVLSVICFNRKSSPLSYGIVFVMSVSIMSPGFMTRPQLVTFVFTSLFLFVFHLYLERKKNLLWLLPLIMVLWVNNHGGFLIGVGIFPVVVACETFSCLVKKTDRNHLRSLILWLVLTEISVLINPYGFKILMFLHESLSVPRSISEWGPVGIFDFSYMRFKILSILVIMSLFVDKKRNRYWEIGVIAITMLYAFLHQRHTPIFAIVAAPFLTERLSELGKRIRLGDRIHLLSSYIILNIALIVLIGYQVSHTANKYIQTKFNIIVDPNIYPVQAVRFLKENKIAGNILLPFEWGEYVIWKLYPDCKVSIDGRFRTVYPEDVLDDHLRNLNDGSQFMDVIHKYKTDILLVRRSPHFRELIESQEKWIYLYSDQVSFIFLKDSTKMQKILEKINKKEIVYPDKEISIYFP
jgi:hypothetical protein